MKLLKYVLFSLLVVNFTFPQDSLNCKLVSVINDVNAYGMSIRDNYAFVTSNKFYIVDIADINNPQIVFEDSIAAEINSVFVEGNYAYLGAGEGLIIMDITSYSSPQVISFHKTDKYIEEVIVDNGIAYLGTLNYAFLIIDVTDPNNPVEIGRVDKNIDDVWGLEIVNDKLFAASEDTGVKIFSIANPAEPEELSVLTSTPNSTLVDMKVKDNIVYVVHPNALYAFDIADLSNPLLLGELSGGGGLSVFIQGSYAYCNNYKELRVIDISNPADLKIAGYYPLPAVGSDIFVKNNLIYVPCQNEGVYVIQFDTQTDVNEKNTAPAVFLLSQNYPNPFNPVTTINYSLPYSSAVSLKIYDVLGNEVAVLVNEVKSAGTHKIEFNANSLSSGVYFYKLEADFFSATKKLLLMK